MTANPDSKQFLACVQCGNVVMRTLVPPRKKKSTSMIASKARLKVTYCRSCDKTDMIRNSSTYNEEGVVMYINKRMVESWYIYKALTRFADEGVDMDDNPDTLTVRLINRHEFVHTKDIYELTSIIIHPDSPEDAIAQFCPHLITGFF